MYTFMSVDLLFVAHCHTALAYGTSLNLSVNQNQTQNTFFSALLRWLYAVAQNHCLYNSMHIMCLRVKWSLFCYTKATLTWIPFHGRIQFLPIIAACFTQFHYPFVQAEFEPLHFQSWSWHMIFSNGKKSTNCLPS